MKPTGKELVLATPPSLEVLNCLACKHELHLTHKNKTLYKCINVGYFYCVLYFNVL